MKTKKIKYGVGTLIISLLVLLSLAFPSKTNNESYSLKAINEISTTCNDCPQGYTYVTVIENEEVWIYVYCGTLFIEKYRDDESR
jgi:hypothetical protein